MVIRQEVRKLISEKFKSNSEERTIIPLETNHYGHLNRLHRHMFSLDFTLPFHLITHLMTVRSINTKNADIRRDQRAVFFLTFGLNFCLA